MKTLLKLAQITALHAGIILIGWTIARLITGPTLPQALTLYVSFYIGWLAVLLIVNKTEKLLDRIHRNHPMNAQAKKSTTNK